MRLVELGRATAALAPGAPKGAVLVEHQDAGMRVAVPLGHEDRTVGRDEHVVRLEQVPRFACAAGGAEREQQLARRAELENLVTDLRDRRRGERRRRVATRAAWRIVLAVGHPDVAVSIDMDAMGEHHESGAEAGDHPARGVELHHRVAGRAEAAVCPAAFRDPDARAVLVEVDGAERAPREGVGQLGPALDGPVRIREVVGWAGGGPLGGGDRARGREGQQEGGEAGRAHQRNVQRPASWREGRGCAPKPTDESGSRSPSPHAASPAGGASRPRWSRRSGLARNRN